MSQEQTTDIFLASKVGTPVSLDNQEQFLALGASNMRKDVTISGKKKVTKQPPVFFKTTSSVSTMSSAAVSAQVAGSAKDDVVATESVVLHGNMETAQGGEEMLLTRRIASGLGSRSSTPVLCKFINRTNVCFANSACNLILNSPLIKFCRDGALRPISAFLQPRSTANNVKDVLRIVMKRRTTNGANYLDKHHHDPAELLDDIIGIMQKENGNETLEASFNEVEICLDCHQSKQTLLTNKIYKFVNKFSDSSIQVLLAEHMAQNPCRHCKTICETRVCRTPIILPQTLILQANRIDFVNGKLTKQNFKIEANKIIHIGEDKFQLRSIIVHHGEVPTSGHYTILIYNAHKDCFTRVNDEAIEHAFDNNLLSQGVVFCYVRIESRTENFHSPMKEFPQQSKRPCTIDSPSTCSLITTASTTIRSPVKHSPLKASK